MNNNSNSPDENAVAKGCTCLVLIFPFLIGNFCLISSVFEDDFDIITSSGLNFLFVAIAVITDIVIIGLIIKQVFEKKLKNKSDEIRKQIEEEIIDIIKYKQGILDDINRFFSRKGQVVSFIQLISMCDKDDSILKEYQKTEDISFKASRKEMVSKLDRKEVKRFPKDVIQINSYIRRLKKDILTLRHVQISLQKADSKQLDEIIKEFCPILKKEKVKRKRKTIVLVSFLGIGLVSAAILLSSNFAMFMAETYHKEVLNEQLNANGIYGVCVKDIEYVNEYEEYYYDYGKIRSYFTTRIILSIDESFSMKSKDDLDDMKNLYSLFSVNIEYWWAMHEIYFENSDDLKITAIIDDNECLIIKDEVKKTRSKVG